LHSSVFPDNGQAAAHAIHLGMAHGVCDGSYMSEVSPDFATAAWIAISHISIYVRESPMFLAHPLRLMPTTLKYKDSMLYFWQSKDIALSTESPPDLSLWDVTIRALFIKPNRPRNLLPAAQFMLTLSAPSVEFTTHSQV